MSRKRRLTAEEREVLRDVISSQQRIQQQAETLRTMTSDPDILECVEDIQYSSERAIVRLVKWLLPAAVVAGALIYAI